MNFLKKWLKDDQKIIEVGPYFEYNQSELDLFKEKFSDIEMDEITIPKIAGFDESFSVKNWFVKDGMQVHVGKVLCEVMAGSLTMELESYLDGWIYFRRQPTVPLESGDFLCLITARKLTD